MAETSNKRPKSALALYVMLYCKKKGSSTNKHILMEATTSWVALSKADKQHFFNVFKEYEKKIVQKFATYLQTAKPYLKKTHKNERPKGNQGIATTEHNVTNNINSCLPNTEEQQTDEQNNEDEMSESRYDNTHLQSIPDIPRPMSEPLPPVITSQELFEIIKNNNKESAQDVDWAQLSRSQKRRYQTAVRTIKKNYLKQYTAFLEQLPPEQLFQYYKSKF